MDFWVFQRGDKFLSRAFLDRRHKQAAAIEINAGLCARCADCRDFVIVIIAVVFYQRRSEHTRCADCKIWYLSICVRNFESISAIDNKITSGITQRIIWIFSDRRHKQAAAIEVNAGLCARCADCRDFVIVIIAVVFYQRRSEHTRCADCKIWYLSICVRNFEGISAIDNKIASGVTQRIV